MSNQTSYRQGEVLLIKETSEIEFGSELSTVLAEGEATGHKHEIIDGQVFERKYWGGENKFVVSNGNTTLIHPEHGPVKIDKGVWRVRIQREYSESQNIYVAD